jgi:AcrR family transcriptional regulator
MERNTGFAMPQTATAPRRPRGRPQVRPDNETLRVIVDAAREEFLSRSFGDVSMASVAQRAGVSTKTMYRLVPTKADIFRKVVSARIGQFILELDVEALDGLKPVDALTRILTVSASLMLGAEATAMYRVALVERDSFPEIASFFFENAIGPASQILEAWLRKQCEHGVLKLADTRLASGMLRGMIAMEPQRAALLGQRPLPDAAEIAARARACAELFLNGCLAGSRSDEH